MLPQVRHMASIQPADTVYSGPQSAPPRRVTLRTIRQMYAKNEPLSMVTAYDYPSAVHVSRVPCNLLSGSHSDLTWNLSGRDERYNVSASCLIPKKELCWCKGVMCLQVVSTTSQPFRCNAVTRLEVLLLRWYGHYFPFLEASMRCVMLVCRSTQRA